MSRRVAGWVPLGALLCSALLGACTGGEPAGAPSGSGSARGAGAKHARVTKEAPPPAQMQVGTNFASGVLARYCEGSRCDADAAAHPRLSLEATEEGLLLFVLRRRPASAKVEVLKANGRQVMHQALHTGSLTLAVHEDLIPGTYVVRLNAAWHGHDAVWLFGLKVPRSRG